MAQNELITSSKSVLILNSHSFFIESHNQAMIWTKILQTHSAVCMPPIQEFHNQFLKLALLSS
jgi:hypothetical protein